MLLLLVSHNIALWPSRSVHGSIDINQHIIHVAFRNRLIQEVIKTQEFIRTILDIDYEKSVILETLCLNGAKKNSKRKHENVYEQHSAISNCKHKPASNKKK